MPYIPTFEGTILHYAWSIFLISVPVFFIMEAFDLFSLGYSKFAIKEKKMVLPSKLGMFLAYFPPIIIYPLIYFYYDTPGPLWHILAMLLVTLHFAKRCLETFFVHKYSGVMNLGSALIITGLYAIITVLLACTATFEVNHKLLESESFQPQLILGTLLWAIGLFINATHHILLSRLRKPGQTEYVFPKGGLFKWIACPHYLGEILAWCGYALLFHHIGAYIVTTAMTAYLMGRSFKTLKWYQNQFKEIPLGWKRIIPFIY